MKKFILQIELLLVGLLLSACSATGPIFSVAAPPTKGEALIYLYRPDAPFYGGIQSHFYVDGKKVASLNKQGYSAFYLPSGAYIFKNHWTGMDNAKETIQFPVEFRPGEIHYYRLTIALESFDIVPVYKGFFISASHKWIIRDVPEREALKEIELTHFQPPFDIKSVRKIGIE